MQHKLQKCACSAAFSEAFAVHLELLQSQLKAVSCASAEGARSGLCVQPARCCPAAPRGSPVEPTALLLWMGDVYVLCFKLSR